MTKKRGFPLREGGFGFLHWRALRFGMFFLLLPPPFTGLKPKVAYFHVDLVLSAHLDFLVGLLALSLGCTLSETVR